MTTRRTGPGLIRRLLAIAGAGLAGFAVTLVAAEPAAAVPNLIVAIDWSDQTGSQTRKYAEAYCPAGTVVLGGGADILSGGGQVRLVALTPLANGAAPDSFRGMAVEDASGYAGDWTMYTWAICGAGVTGWQIVSSTYTSVNNEEVAGDTVACPAGTKVIGLGATVTNNLTRTFLVDLRPFGNLGHALASAARDENALGLPITVTVHAVCVNPVPGQQLVSASTASNSIDAKHIAVMCPAGTRLHGAGGSASNGYGQVSIDRIGLVGAGAVGGADIEAREDETGFPDSWTATAYAICAT